MIKYRVQKRVETENYTEIFDAAIHAELSEAMLDFETRKQDAETYAGEYNEGQFKQHYTEKIEVESFDEQTQNFETVVEVVVYIEAVFDKNNYRGECANNYWGVGKWNGSELVYTFSYDGKIEYENIKASELDNWYNYKR